MIGRRAVLDNSHILGLYLISGVCGLVDAACYLGLGGVFAEMMTGNLLLFFLDVGSGQSPLDHAAYLMALAAFAVGAVCGGRIMHGAYGHTRLGFFVEWVLMAGAVALSLEVPLGPGEPGRDVVICTLALAMGMQNALLRKHGVPDLATNVMTLTMTALVAESTISGGTNERWRRRLGSIATFALCAMVGAALTVRVGPWAALALALAVFSVALAGLTRQRP